MQILTKYNFGNIVWMVHNSKIIQGEIQAINIHERYSFKRYITYTVYPLKSPNLLDTDNSIDKVPENDLFLLREDLVNHLLQS